MLRSCFSFLEDFGGHHIFGPSSPWERQKAQDLQGVNHAVRGSEFLCQLVAAEPMRPLGFLTNLESLQKKLHLGRPNLIPGDDKLRDVGRVLAEVV